jgi:hypothetical protein
VKEEEERMTGQINKHQERKSTGTNAGANGIKKTRHTTNKNKQTNKG